MIDVTKLTKRYYTIAEVSELFGVAKSLLRFWEGEFSEIQPRKDRGGIRRYTVKDILRIEEIYQLLKVRGFTIEGAKKELASTKPSDKTTSDVKLKLTKALEQLKALREKLNQYD